MLFHGMYSRRPALLQFCHLAAFILIAAASPAYAADNSQKSSPIVVVTHCDYPPVSSWDKNTNRPVGFSVDVIENIAALSGRKVAFLCKHGWPEMMTAIESGEADTGALFKSEEREKKFLFTSPMEISYLSFFARSHSSIDPDNLHPANTVGVITGSMSYEVLKTRPGLKLHTVESYQHGIFSLLAGETDLFAGEEAMILKRARTTRLEDRIKRVGKPIVERERGFAVRKDNVQLYDLLNRAMPDFIASSEYQQIYLKWYGAPTPYWTGKRTLSVGGIVLLVVVTAMAFWRYRSISSINRHLIQQVSERRKVESDLELFRNLLNKSREAIFVNDPQTGRYIDMNDRACTSVGYTRAELLTMGVKDTEVSFPDDLLWQDHVAEVRRQGFLILEGTNKRKDGTTFPVETNVSMVQQGGREYMVAVVRDITERKGAEVELRMREKQLAESQRLAHVGSWEHNLTTGAVFWSDELFRLIGLDPESDPADFKLFLERVHPDDRPRLTKAIEESVRSSKSFNIEYRIVLRDGRVRMIHAIAELIHDATGTQNILSGTGQDITERKEAEEKIRRNDQFIRSILDTVDEGFTVIDRDFRILSANRAFCDHVGQSIEEVAGKRCYKISHRTERPCYEEGEDCAVRQVFLTGLPHTALHKHRDRAGHILYVETKGFPIRDDAGKVVSVIETINNITEKHLLEEERLKTQKLESIGTLAGGIAHDFNNLLQGVFGYISMAKISFDRREKALAMLEQAEKALEQTVHLTTQLLTFSKGGKPVKKSIDLRPLIEDSTKFTLSGSRSDCRINIPDDLWQADADAGQIGQVIQNIVLNADQSMPLGGSICVTAVNVAATAPSLPPPLPRGNYVMISVRDMGIGIPSQYIGKIFDPYFTTKEKGSGLGLATSYSIIRNHGGLIDVTTKSGEGSVFNVYLPAVPGEARKEKTAAPVEVRVMHSKRILVMDDEEFLRNLSTELLGALGHVVETASHGQDAIERFQAAHSAGTPFDLVILDLTIRGGMGGIDTIKKLIEIDPAVKAVVSSGYSDDAAIANHLSYGFKAYLKKPYDMSALWETLSSLIA